MQVSPIGIIKTPYKEKFAIPRQPGLAEAAIGEIFLAPECNDINCLRGIETFSHLWLTFYFHGTAEQGWKPTIRPPRLGGNQKMGVFASRSTFRPNPFGLSVVAFDSVIQEKGQVILRVKGVDLLDGTPILDIKPYLPYADALPHAEAGYAPEPPALIKVSFTQQAKKQLAVYQEKWPLLSSLIEQVLSQDPRPAYKHALLDDPKVYGVRLYDLDIKWQVVGGECLIVGAEEVKG